MLEFLPNWAVHTLVLVGVLGLMSSAVLKFIPFIKVYGVVLEVGSLLLIIVGVWFEGAISNQSAWQARVAELQVKVAEAEVKSSQANTQIVTKIIDKTKTVRDKGDTIISYIDREVVKNNEVIKFVEDCPIPDIIIKTHNAAALNQSIEANK